MDGRSDHAHRETARLQGGAVARSPPALTVAGVPVGVRVDTGVQLTRVAAASFTVAARRRRPHRDHVDVARRVVDRRRIGVSRGREQNHAGIRCILQCVVGRGVAVDTRCSEAHARHIRPVVRGPDQTVLDVREEQGAVAVRHLHRHDAAAARDPRHAEVVVGHRTRDARGRGPMALREGIIVGVVVVVAGVDPLNQVGQEIRVIDVNTGVEDRNHHTRAPEASEVGPGLLGVGVETGGAHRVTCGVPTAEPAVVQHLTSVVVPPLRGIGRVVGNRARKSPVVGCGRLDDRVLAIPFCQSLHVTGGNLDGVPAIQPDLSGQRHSLRVGEFAHHLHHAHRLVQGIEAAKPGCRPPGCSQGVRVQGWGGSSDLDEKPVRPVRRKRLSGTGEFALNGRIFHLSGCSSWILSDRDVAGHKDSKQQNEGGNDDSRHGSTFPRLRGIVSIFEAVLVVSSEETLETR